MLYVSVRIFPNGKGQSDRVDLDWRAGQELVIHYWFFSFGMSECWRKSFGRGKTTRKVCNMVSIYFSNAVTFLKIKVMSSSFSKDATTRCYTQVGWPFMKRTRFVCFYIEIFLCTNNLLSGSGQWIHQKYEQHGKDRKICWRFGIFNLNRSDGHERH